MPARSGRGTRARLALAATAALAALATVATTAGTSAAAAPAVRTPSASESASSTPIDIVTPDGMLMSYVVNADRAGSERTLLAAQAVRRAGGTVVQTWPQIGVVVAHSRSADFRTTVVRRAADHAVVSAAPSRTTAVVETPAPNLAAAATSRATRVTPDPKERLQWDMKAIKADVAHRTSGGSHGVLVGVLDSGVDPTHPDLRPNIDRSASVSCTNAGRPDTSAEAWSPTSSTHGTHVAGILAAAKNGRGIVGVAPNVRIASVKVADDGGWIYPEYAICGYVWSALHGMDVINNSYFIDPIRYWCADQPDQAAVLLALDRALAYAQRRGVVVVASTGNDSDNLAAKTTDYTSPGDSVPVPRRVNDGCRLMPTEAPGVVGVSSVGPTNALSPFSNYGVGVVDVTAPGENVISSFWGGGYGYLSGTSMAAPHVSGVAALLRSTHPHWRPERVALALSRRATELPCPAWSAGCRSSVPSNGFFGGGLTNALAAVR